MKTIFAVVLLLILSSAWAQDENSLLETHVENISLALQDLQEELLAMKNKHEKNKILFERLQKEQQDSYSLVRKGKIIYYEREIEKEQQKIRDKETQLYTYYGVLEAFQRYRMSPEQKNNGKRFIGEFENREILYKEKIKAAETRAADSQTRMRQIEQEIPLVEKKIAGLKRKLKVLNDKKTWDNLTERTSLTTQIGLQNSLLLKLKGETKVREEIRDDAWAERKALQLELAETKIALRIFRE